MVSDERQGPLNGCALLTSLDQPRQKGTRAGKRGMAWRGGGMLERETHDSITLLKGN